MFDARPKEVRLIESLADAHYAILDAQEKLEEAKSSMEKIWQTYLDNNRGGDLNLPYTAIVQDGSWIVEIVFDFDDFSTPHIKRIDSSIRIYKKE